MVYENDVLKLVKMEIDAGLAWIFEPLLEKAAAGWTRHSDANDYSKETYYAWMTDEEKELLTESWNRWVLNSAEEGEAPTVAEIVSQEEVEDDAQGD